MHTRYPGVPTGKIADLPIASAFRRYKMFATKDMGTCTCVLDRKDTIVLRSASMRFQYKLVEALGLKQTTFLSAFLPASVKSSIFLWYLSRPSHVPLHSHFCYEYFHHYRRIFVTHF